VGEVASSDWQLFCRVHHPRQLLLLLTRHALYLMVQSRQPFQLLFGAWTVRLFSPLRIVIAARCSCWPLLEWPRPACLAACTSLLEASTACVGGMTVNS
jgi:hypothetical protein